MKKKWTKWILLLVVIVIVAVVAVLLLGKGYRVIKVDDFDGEVSLERDSDEKELFEGMKLKSEDTLTTEEDGLIELLVDTDKHILARENTCFTIQSTGNKKKGKLTIDDGWAINRTANGEYLMGNWEINRNKFPNMEKLNGIEFTKFSSALNSVKSELEKLKKDRRRQKK